MRDKLFQLHILLDLTGNIHLTKVSVDETGGRVRSHFRRTGRPRTKWYDTTRNHTIKKLTKEGHLARNVRDVSTRQELNAFIVQMAQGRHI